MTNQLYIYLAIKPTIRNYKVITYMLCLSHDFSCLISWFLIAESTTFALRIENVDITGFDGL